ncbi:hypothetical protein BK009_09945 [Methanobacterium subterraneum]|uniref:DUF3566 domain-containing protein n=1 Tax=Methanobacterium subterraneum TaxID=59277 RepID=A0A2H4VSH2_9EURY|nr:hypothetical protein [Methanobacterium subterraneum]AUB60970.1 hypothetical protein BK009_09945 [Methanobacterium subterraneum]
MEELKEIKSVAIVPYTLMSSSISAVVGLIYALILVMVLGVVAVFLPSEASIITSILMTLSIALIIILPVGGFLLSILSSFLTAFIYNQLVPRIGGIKIGIVEMEEITSISVIPASLMLSLLYTIITFLIMLIVAPILVVALQGAALAAISTSTSVAGLDGLGALGIIGIIIMIIGVPILVLVATFISTAIMALVYNFLAPQIGGVKLKFASIRENIFEIKKIAPIPVALIGAVVVTIVNFIFSLPSLAMYFATSNPWGGIGYFLGNTIGTLVFTFIIYTIMALLYNFLRSVIGGVELELE